MCSAFLKTALSSMNPAHTNARAEKTQLQFAQFACIRPTDPESALINKHAARSVIFCEIQACNQFGLALNSSKMSITTV